jgi:hypothetical protein
MNNINPKNDPKNVVICEANGCNSKAEVKVIVRVGLDGKIAFFLCERCKPKFCVDDDDNCTRLDDQGI